MSNAEDNDKLSPCAEFEDYMSIEGYELVKEISKEEAVKAEYSYEKEGWGSIIYNHSEKLTISEKYFDQEKGKIALFLIAIVEPTVQKPNYKVSLSFGHIELDYELTADGRVEITNLEWD